LRRAVGKSDPIDAEAAARAVFAGTAQVAPKFGDGRIEAIRALRVARGGAVKAKTAAVNSLKALLVTAPEPLRASLQSHGSAIWLVGACVRLRADARRLGDPIQATKLALHGIATRVQALAREIAQLDAQLRPLILEVAPSTIAPSRSAPTRLARSWSRSVTTLSAFAPKRPSPDSAESLPFPRRPARPSATVCTAEATARPTGRCTSRSSCACATARAPVPTLRGVPSRGAPSRRSSVA